SLAECRVARLTFVSRGGQEHIHASHPLALLRPRRDRPRCRRATEQRDELAASDHSITSSALASNVAGTVTPSDLAVFRFTLNPSLVACSPGSPLGFAPFKMRST